MKDPQAITYGLLHLKRKKNRGLTQSYDENPYTYGKYNNQSTTQKRHTSITQRLRTDLGRSMG